MTAELIIVATAARALAGSAAKLGMPLQVFDAFGDRDTLGTWHPLSGDIVAGLDFARVAESLPALPAVTRSIVVGGGIEAAPAALDTLARCGRLYANETSLVAAVAEPDTGLELLRCLGWETPETRRDPPADLSGWLLKRRGACGGWHVRRATASPAERNDYYQREAAGSPMSVTFLADGEYAYILGFNRQTPVAVADRPFCHGGAVAESNPPRWLRDYFNERMPALVRTTGLRGLNGIDFLLDGERVLLLELNARPTASFELYEDDVSEGLLAWHLRSFERPVPEFAARLADRGPTIRGYAVVYAERSLQVPQGLDFPLGCRDLPRAGHRIESGMPVLSLFAAAQSSAEVTTQIDAMRKRVYEALAHW